MKATREINSLVLIMLTMGYTTLERKSLDFLNFNFIKWRNWMRWLKLFQALWSNEHFCFNVTTLYFMLFTFSLYFNLFHDNLWRRLVCKVYLASKYSVNTVQVLLRSICSRFYSRLCIGIHHCFLSYLYSQIRFLVHFDNLWIIVLSHILVSRH